MQISPRLLVLISLQTLITTLISRTTASVVNTSGFAKELAATKICASYVALARRKILQGGSIFATPYS